MKDVININNVSSRLIDLNSIDNSEEIIISNSIIDEINFASLIFSKKVCISKCIIDKFVIHSSWFEGGLNFVDNIVLSDIDYQMGGHNITDFVLERNLFNGFFSFFDCQFEGNVIVKDNIFKKGSDLLLKEDKGFDNLFERQLIIENNIGHLDMFLDLI
ncbi:hypothetical protein H8S77_07820 [Parabacteroides sp. BX2]|jgi:hypothetical protein|uniref:Pentapeptide repeat-containing protein n=1 Tax=Parabacteroides segnis TaxID=2763058 RepID=A0ABR7DZ57_9BACT|nr:MULTISPECIES: hypothetical protein [Parabacteroides]MBC5642792.1 hypothetical protein [Parabacteroides segnis]MCM0713820.1 hypothetical protein [Parabacteroides sp. TA-V-105]